MSRVLYLSYDGMTDPLGQSQVLPYLVGLSRRGYTISLVSFEKPERLEAGRKEVEKLCRDHHISWYPLRYTRKPPVLSTLKDIRSLQRLVGKLHAQQTFDIVHCRSYITALVGLKLKREKGVKFVFDMRGFWADERVDGKIWNLKNPLFRLIYRYFKKKEKQFFSEADYSISLTHAARSIIQDWPGIRGQPVPIEVIPCCVDLEHFDPARVQAPGRDRLRQQLNIPEGGRVLTYVGSVGTWYMLPEMMAFFRRWLIRHPEDIFLFISHDDPAAIRAEAERRQVPASQIRVQGAKRAEMPLYLSLGDYSVFFIRPVFSKKASSPTKQGEIMAMGIPVICNSGVGDTDYVVQNWSSGRWVDQFTDEAYDQVIASLEQASFDPVAIRRGAEEFFSLEEGVRRYEGVYKKVLGT